jgi:hypothetical protein
VIAVLGGPPHREDPPVPGEVARDHHVRIADVTGREVDEPAATLPRPGFEYELRAVGTDPRNHVGGPAIEEIGERRILAVVLDDPVEEVERGPRSRELAGVHVGRDQQGRPITGSVDVGPGRRHTPQLPSRGTLPDRFEVDDRRPGQRLEPGRERGVVVERVDVDHTPTGRATHKRIRVVPCSSFARVARVPADASAGRAFDFRCVRGDGPAADPDRRPCRRGKSRPALPA